MDASIRSIPEKSPSFQDLQKMLNVEGDGPEVHTRLMHKIEVVLAKQELLDKLASKNKLEAPALKAHLEETMKTLKAATSLSKNLEKEENRSILSRIGRGIKKTGSFLWRNKGLVIGAAAVAVIAYLGWGYFVHLLAGLAHQAATVAPASEIIAAGATESTVGPAISTLPGAGFGTTPGLMGGGGTYLPDLIPGSMP